MSKTVYKMAKDGWCDDCMNDPNDCLRNGGCEGYKNYTEKEETDEKTD